MLTGYRSIITAVVGIGFIFAAKYIPKEFLSDDMRVLVVSTLEGLYGIFLAAKVNRLIAQYGDTQK